jgi:uncharacterized membrane protein
MPSIAAIHPQVVHFAIALLLVGVVFRLISLTGRFAFTGPAATALVLLGTLAAAVAAQSGIDAHGPVERVPGARAAVVEHEEWGLRARNVAFAVAALELAVLALGARKPPAARVLAMGSGAIGVVAGGLMLLAGSHGGELVYNYAGGVGIRSGDPAHVGNLLVAGLYHQAQADRQGGRGTDGAALIDLAAARFPQNLEAQLLSIEWTTDVRKDPAAALQRLESLVIPPTDTRMRIRAGQARVTALVASGNVEAARQVLMTLKSEFPTNAGIQRRLDELSTPK